VRTDRVEVAQDADAPGRIGLVQVAQHVFDHQLGAAVGVDRRQRMDFGIGQEPRRAVHRGRGAEDKRLHPGRLHGLQQRQAARDIVAVVVERLFR
jgi:hypothetical protein